MDSTLVSGIMGLVGALIGGIFSYIGSKSATKDNIVAQNKVIQENKQLDNLRQKESLETNLKIIYLDLINALYEGFMFLKKKEYPIIGSSAILPTMNQYYSTALSSVSSLFDANELVLLHGLYGMIEKIRNEILKTNGFENSVINSYLLLECVVFEDNYIEIKNLSVDMITKDYLITKLSSKYYKIFDKLMKHGNIA